MKDGKDLNHQKVGKTVVSYVANWYSNEKGVAHCLRIMMSMT